MSRGSNHAAPLSGVKPRAMNGSQNRASSAATQKSAASAMWKPSPAAQPRTTATMGTCVSSINGISLLALFGSRRCVLPTRGLRSDLALLAIRSDAGAEVGAVGVDADDAHRFVDACGGQVVDHRVEHHVVDRISLVGAVQRQLQYGTLLFGPQARHTGVAHGTQRSANRADTAVSSSVRSLDPPVGSGRRTGPCSRLGSRMLACPGAVTSSR